MKRFRMETKCGIFILLKSFLKGGLYNSRDVCSGARRDKVCANSVDGKQDVLFLDHNLLLRLLISLNKEALFTLFCNCLE